jgi:hypothetical protein
MLQPTCPLPSRAYNLQLLHEEGRPGPGSHGRCFGLPPGILPQQWPLDPRTGYPLVQAFTLRLPEITAAMGPRSRASVCLPAAPSTAMAAPRQTRRS